MTTVLVLDLIIDEDEAPGPVLDRDPADDLSGHPGFPDEGRPVVPGQVGLATLAGAERPVPGHAEGDAVSIWDCG